MVHWTPAPQSFVVSLTSNDAKPSKKMQKCATHDNLCFPGFAMLWNWQLDVQSRTPVPTGKKELGAFGTPLSYQCRDGETFVLEVTKNCITPAGLTLSLTLAEVNTFFIGGRSNYPHISKKPVSFSFDESYSNYGKRFLEFALIRMHQN
jgi:hypothetical protein